MRFMSTSSILQTVLPVESIALLPTPVRGHQSKDTVLISDRCIYLRRTWWYWHLWHFGSKVQLPDTAGGCGWRWLKFQTAFWRHFLILLQKRDAEDMSGVFGRFVEALMWVRGLVFCTACCRNCCRSMLCLSFVIEIVAIAKDWSPSV